MTGSFFQDKVILTVVEFRDNQARTFNLYSRESCAMNYLISKQPSAHQFKIRVQNLHLINENYILAEEKWEISQSGKSR